MPGSEAASPQARAVTKRVAWHLGVPESQVHLVDTPDGVHLDLPLDAAEQLLDQIENSLED